MSISLPMVIVVIMSMFAGAAIATTVFQPRIRLQTTRLLVMPIVGTFFLVVVWLGLFIVTGQFLVPGISIVAFAIPFPITYWYFDRSMIEIEGYVKQKIEEGGVYGIGLENDRAIPIGTYRVTRSVFKKCNDSDKVKIRVFPDRLLYGRPEDNVVMELEVTLAYSGMGSDAM